MSTQLRTCIKPCFLLIVLVLLLSGTKAQHTGYLGLHGGWGSAQGKELKLGSGLSLDLELPLGDKVLLNFRPSLNRRNFNYGGLSPMVEKATYFDIPVTLIFLKEDQDDLGFYGGFGAYYGMALSGKVKRYDNSGNLSWSAMKFGEKATDDRVRTDFGAVLDFGVRFGEGKRTAKVGLQIMHGIKDIAPAEQQNNPTASISRRLRNYTFYVAVALF